MSRNIQSVRNIELIEEELNSSIAGIVSFLSKEEKIIQIALTFIYFDKNIYISLQNEEELSEKINFEIKANFALLKNTSVKQNKSKKTKDVYKFFSVNIIGKMRKVDDQKLIEEFQRQYLLKYSLEEKEDKDIKKNVYIIDTEEIQAFEETGN